jgi:Na+-transporting NADH:ubiquinone oxidoreductase subunit C
MQSNSPLLNPLQRFLQQPNDSTSKTIGVALVLCLVCSVFVSAAAVLLKPLQTQNKLRDFKENILAVAGLEPIVTSMGKDYAQLSLLDKFAFIETRIVDLRTGEYAPHIDPAQFDLQQTARNPQTSDVLSKAEDIAGIQRRPHYAPVYVVKTADQVHKVIIPIYGKGLWSTLYGFLSLRASDLQVEGISFYAHKETPGLGGEVDNPNWRAQFVGKSAYDADGVVRLALAKQSTGSELADLHYVDALSGATLTSRGVTQLLQFWLGEQGFAPFLRSQFGQSGT